MKTRPCIHVFSTAFAAALLLCGALSVVAAEEDFATLVKRLQAEKPAFADRQQKLLAERYDLADRPAPGVAMARGKPVQAGVRVKLPAGQTWEKLGAMAPADIKSQNQWPAGFYPLSRSTRAASVCCVRSWIVARASSDGFTACLNCGRVLPPNVVFGACSSHPARSDSIRSPMALGLEFIEWFLSCSDVAHVHGSDVRHRTK